MPDRWLRPLGGATEAELAAGSTSGWQQPEDVEIVGDNLPIDPFHGYPTSFRKGARYYRYTSSEDQMDYDEDVFCKGMRDVLIGLGEAGDYVDLSFVASGAPPAFGGMHDIRYGPNPGGDDWQDNHTAESTVGIWRKNPRGLNPQASVFQQAWLPEPPEGAIGYESEVAEVQEGVFLPLALPLSAHVEVPIFGAISTAYPNLEPWATNFDYAMRANHVWRNGTSSRVDIDPLGYWVGQGTTPPWTATAAMRTMAEVAKGGVAIPDLGLQGPGNYDAHVPIEGLVDMMVEEFAPDASPYLGVFTLWESIDARGLEIDEDGMIVRDPVFGAGSAAMNGREVNIEARGGNEGEVIYTARPARFRWIFGSPVAPTVDAPRRVFPRDDALAGGAGRTFPPSRAEQSSNRTVGGYL